MANVHLYQHSGHTMHCGIYAGGRLSPPTLSSSFLDLHQYMYIYIYVFVYDVCVYCLESIYMR